MDALGEKAIHLLRGRIESLQRVYEYRCRRGGRYSSVTRSAHVPRIGNASNVVALSPHPTMRIGPSMSLLGRLEAVLRELRGLLDRGLYQDLCCPDSIGLSWSKLPAIEVQKRELEFCIWEGTTACEEGSVDWAGLCWQSALLQLEHLLWYPDLDLWTIFIRSCIRLQRFGAVEVGRHLLQKLQGLRHLLPLTAPHRQLLYALTDTSSGELANDGLFILEAKLRNIELLWPNEPHVYTAYQIDLAEERFYHGYDNVCIDSLSQEELHNTSVDEMFEQTAMKASQISKYMTLLDYPKAEELVHRWITQLEHHRG